jgi:hypothetical protein
MNCKKALEILEIDLPYINDISLIYLQKQYRKLALINHPDKNGNTLDSNEKFKEINNAYTFLKKEINNLNSYQDEDEIDENNNSSIYVDILTNFIKNIFDKKYTELLSKIVIKILNAGKNISIHLFDDLNKDTTLYIYIFLSNNRSILHLNEEILNIIRDIVVKKYDNVEIYKLNPNINDLINNNVYKLVINENLYLVPLWHNECYFDSSGCEIIVICDPELPENIRIDDDNNICIKTIISQKKISEMIISNNSIKINIGEKEYIILLSNLYMKKEQNYRILNQGLSKIKNDIYDISDKSDIIVNITII